MDSKAANLEQFEQIDFQKYWLVLQRRWIPTIGVFGIAVTLAGVKAFSLTPTYTAESSLLIKTNRTPSLTGLGEAIGKLDSLVRDNSPLDTQVKIITSVPVIQETIDTLDLKNSGGKSLKYKDFIGKLKVESVTGTDIIEIHYTPHSAP